MDLLLRIPCRIYVRIPVKMCRGHTKSQTTMFSLREQRSSNGDLAKTLKIESNIFKKGGSRLLSFVLKTECHTPY